MEQDCVIKQDSLLFCAELGLYRRATDWKGCVNIHREVYLLVNCTFSFQLSLPFVQSQHFPKRHISPKMLVFSPSDSNYC